MSLAALISDRFTALERRAYLRLSTSADRRARARAEARGLAPKPEHLRIGERGEDLAFFYLRQRGYTIIARRWRSARLKGDLDLVGWDGQCLVIFEVKTRTSRNFSSAEAAVDKSKIRMLRRMGQLYRRRLPEPWRELVSIRFDVVSVYDLPTRVEFEHLRNAFPFAGRPGAR